MSIRAPLVMLAGAMATGLAGYALAEPMAADPSMLHAKWAGDELPRARVVVACSEREVRQQLLVLAVRDLELLGDDDVVGVATLSLLRLEVSGQTMNFAADLTRDLEACARLEGRMQLLALDESD